MNPRACIDAGLVTLYFQEKCPTKVMELFNSIKKGNIKAYLPRVMMVESFKHLCVASGKDHAKNCLESLEYNLLLTFIELTNELAVKAGALKCQFRKKLSYYDCIGIAVALLKNASFHTTEKEIPKIQGLKVQQYEF